MSRPLRIEYPNALYHVMSHGNGNLWLYKKTTDMTDFINCLTRITEKYHFKVYAFTLMKNHYHILLKTPLGNLSRGMMHFNREIAILHNKKKIRTGSVFKHRYKAKLIQEDGYFGNAYQYIIDNPLKTGMWDSSSSYEGSHLYWLKKGDQAVQKIITDPIISSVNEIQFMRSIKPKETEYNLRYYFTGDKDWVQKIKETFKNRKMSEEIKEGWRFAIKAIDEHLIRTTFEKHEKKLADNVIMFLRHQFTDITLKKLGIQFGIQKISTVSQRIRAVKAKMKNDYRVLNLFLSLEKAS